MMMKPRDEVATSDQSTSIATQSYCYLSIRRVFPHELRALPEMAAKRKGMANPPHRASMFILFVRLGYRNLARGVLAEIRPQKNAGFEIRSRNASRQ